MNEQKLPENRKLELDETALEQVSGGTQSGDNTTQEDEYPLTMHFIPSGVMEYITSNADREQTDSSTP